MLWLLLLVVGVAEAVEWGLIIDAGSSGSRMRVFQWGASDLITQVDLGDDDSSFETSPGLSSYVSNPSEAGESLASIVDAATTVVPAASHANTTLYVMATAGMRLLNDSQADPIFDDVRDFLRAYSPFVLGTVGIISGEEEALFGYVAVNFNLYGDDSWVDTTGVGSLDLGGASTQVLFEPTDSLRDGEFDFYLNETRKAAYARSFLGYGQDQAVDRYQEVLVAAAASGAEIVDNPCYNSGYDATVTIAGQTVRLNGTGNATACETLAREILHLDYLCIRSPCTVAGTYIPPLEGDFIAYSGFFYAANGVGLLAWSASKDLTYVQLKDAGAKYCALNISDALDVSGSSLDYAKDYCFTSLYAAHLLEAHGFSDTDNITFTRKINGVSADWSLGAMYYETQLLPFYAQTFCTSSRRTVYVADDDDDDRHHHLRLALNAYKIAVTCLAFALVLLATLTAVLAFRLRAALTTRRAEAELAGGGKPGKQATTDDYTSRYML